MLGSVYLNVFGSSGNVEVALWVLLFVLSVCSLWRYRYCRPSVVRLVMLSTLALAFRWVVPWAPANFYADFAGPYDTFRYNESYTHAIYDLSLRFSPGGPFWANWLMGASVPALLYLTLRLRPALPGTHVNAERLALVMGLMVAVLPLYVRLSASDAPHVAGLFALALGGLCYARALTGGGLVHDLGFVVAAYLVGATRRELALAPVMYLFLGLDWYGWAVFKRGAQRWRALALVTAVVGGLAFTQLSAVGHSNSVIELNASSLLAYTGGLPDMLLLRGSTSDVVSNLFLVGVLALLVTAAKKREFGLIAGYVVGMVLFTLPYAFERAFAHSYSSPLYPLTLARYALCWFLFPSYFAARGLLRIFRRRWLFYVPVDRFVVASLLMASMFPMYGSLHTFQAEYLFLRGFQRDRRDSLPVLVGWQKHAGIDLCDALATPYYAIAGRKPDVRWLSVGASEALPESLERGGAEFYFYANALLDVRVPQPQLHGPWERELEATLRRYRELSCIAREHGQVVASAQPVVMPTQFELNQPGRLTLAIVRVQRPAAGWRGVRCSRSDTSLR